MNRQQKISRRGMFSSLFRSVSLFSAVLWGTIFFPVINTPSAPIVRTYYVDCTGGLDSNSGTSPKTAWASTGRANRAVLAPGDNLLLKRGCTWTTRLDLAYSGTSNLPIRIGAYGSGSLPRILNGENQGVKISGSYLVIEYIEVHADWKQTDPNCKSQPYGYYQVGFNFLDGASYNILRYSEASGNTIGIKLAYGAHHNQVVANNVHHNNVLQILDHGNPKNDLGAWGILVNGNDNEIGWNTIHDNDALCSYGPHVQGTSIELYGAQRNVIDHNIVINDADFTELGGSSDRHSSDNTYAYNLYSSSAPFSRFLIITGEKDTVYGPTYRTTFSNNTAYQTAPDSQGVVCWQACSGNTLTLENNILWAEEKAIYADAPFNESNNIYWNTAGAPVVQFQGFKMHPTSRIANPLFSGSQGLNFHLSAGSPAVNEGMSSGWKVDLGNTILPQGSTYDIGAYEYKP